MDIKLHKAQVEVKKTRNDILHLSMVVMEALGGECDMKNCEICLAYKKARKYFRKYKKKAGERK